MQLDHQDTKFLKKTFPITVVCDQITSPANVGSIFRAADAFGVEKILFCGEVIPDFGRRMQKTARSTERFVPFEIAQGDIVEVLENLKAKGYKTISVEIADDSLPLAQVPIAIEDKIALVIGGESLGIAEEVLKMSDNITHITMYGYNSSMNVAQALTLALYEFTNRLQTIKA